MLATLERGEAEPDLVQGRAGKSTPKLAWLFSGEGAEYLGMGKGLYATQPVYRDVVDRFDASLWQDRDGSLAEVMFRDESLLLQPTWRLPALFTLQAALTKLWRSWGIEPDVVLGEGIGQYAAACVAGVMTWEDGLRLVAERSRLACKVESRVATPALAAGAVAVDGQQTPK